MAEDKIDISVFDKLAGDPPEPLPVELREGTGTIDMLAQSVVPKLINRIRTLEWRCDRAERALEIVLEQLSVSNQWQRQATDKINVLIEQTKPKRKAPRKKEDRPVPVVVARSEYADYDPDSDTWKPKEIAGHKITGALIDVLEHMGTSAAEMYPEELLDFTDLLTDDIKAAIRSEFPN